MWAKFSDFLLKNRIAITLFFIAVTAFMGWKAKDIQLSYAGSKILPVTDSAYVTYEKFRKQFGEDGGLVALGVQNEKLYTPEFYNKWQALAQKVQKVKGVSGVLSIGKIFAIAKDTVNRKFTFTPYPAGPVTSAAEMDSVKAALERLKILDKVLYNNDNNSTVMLVTIKNSILNTKARNPLLQQVEAYAKAFQAENNTQVHISGMPYIRTAVSKLVSKEFVLFLGLSIGIAALILLIFFRRIYAVIFPMLVVLMGVICSVGTMVLLGYELTTLTGLIPPLIVIIGVPNSILFLNKYLAELQAGRSKYEALHIAIERIAETTLIANLTAAIGFGVLIYTGSQVLVQFGAVAAINVIVTWLLSIMLIPIIFSWLPAFKVSGAAVNAKPGVITRFLGGINNLVMHRRGLIYLVTAVLAGVALIGISRIKVNGYIVDDLPGNSAILHDLHFFEKNFSGVLPLEVVVDTKRNRGVFNLNTLKRIDRMENAISRYPEFSEPLSIIQGIKLATQAFYNNDTAYYRLPDELDQAFVLTYLSNSTQGVGKSGAGSMLNSLTDAKGRYVRASFNMKDVGSARLDELLDSIQTKVAKILPADKFNVVLTGSSIIFSKGTNYMLRHLFESIGLAIVLISLLRLWQFRSVKIMLISLLPNVVPLLITAGVMGFFGLNLKPSTIIVFTIAFGLASDQTIYFLTRYQQDKVLLGLSTPKAITDTLMETGISMTHIALVLFFGFGIFTASTFGGTVILGLLLSVTLLVALLFNLTLLPALVMWVQGNDNKREDSK